MNIRATFALSASLIGALLLAIGPAYAHQSVELTQGDTTPATGPQLVDGTVSFAVRTDIARGDRRGFRFDLDDGDTLAMQLLIVDTPPGNRLSASRLPRVTLTDPNGDTTRMLISERTEFYEPYGGTNYFYLSRIEDEAIPGTYKVRVTGRSKKPVETVIAVGYREVRGEVRRASRSSEQASLSFAHALPDVNTLDVYAGSTLVASGIGPGQMESQRVKPGKYDIVVVPEGDSPRTSDPLLRIKSVQLSANDDRTVAFHLSATNRPTSSVFTNRTRTVGQDMGYLTFRHIAQAPTVDVRSRGSAMMSNLSNGEEAATGLMSGDYKLRVVREGSRDKLMPISEQTIVNKPGRQDMGNHRIVYLWGSTRNGSLNVMVQDIPLGLR
ncbi:DUF4397 domain-containing protein [bacterium]|nr:DUF4397 domain-containing protein [bacterium]